MKKVAFLSTDNLQNFFTYDRLLFQPMRNLGWAAEEISWKNKNVIWSNYDAVIVRSTWDYQHSSEEFISVLEKINKSTHLENNFDLMKWNMNKRYLFDLEQNGVKIVDTIWEKSFDPKTAIEYFKRFNTDEIIIKPNISANADNTFRLTRERLVSNLSKLEQVFANREFMVQPFLKSIIEEGEYSLFFFDGKISHAVLKKPKENDFRVQEEHGGDIQPINAPQNIISVAESIIRKLSTIPLYGRVDLVRTLQDNFALMELELIEPSLYLNKDNQAPQRFARAFAGKMEKLKVR